jgi:RNA polymerase sigma-70 factor (ECF subfamily)
MNERQVPTLIAVNREFFMPLLSEADCVPALQFERAVVAQQRFLKATALALCRNKLEVDDLVQEAMFKALTNRRRFRAGTNLRGWLCCIMRNHFINNCRRRSREYLTDFSSSEFFSAAQPVPASQETRLYIQDVKNVMELLPEDQRQALLEVISGANYQDAAATLGCEVGTVKSRVSRARSKLLARLGETYPGLAASAA